jgi:hypothetical protein
MVRLVAQVLCLLPTEFVDQVVAVAADLVEQAL